VSSIVSLALHSPPKQLALPPNGHHNNPVKKSLPPLEPQESLGIGEKHGKNKIKRHLHRPINEKNKKGRASGLSMSGRVPSGKSPKQEDLHQIRSCVKA